MPHTDRPGFSPEIFSKWCRLDRFVRGHTRTICDSLHHPDKTLTEECAAIRRKSFENLDDVLTLAGRKSDDPRVLRMSLAVCQGLGDLYKEGQSIPSVSLGGVRYLLFPDRTGPIRDAYPEDERFKLEGETGFSAELELRHHWVSFPSDIEIEPHSGDFLRAGASSRHLRIGLAPFLDRTELDISFHAQFPRATDGAIPFHCCGYKPSDPDLKKRLQKVLRRAYDEGVHILLLPELCVDESLLDFTQRWLRANNIRDPVLRMVVAGSRHCCEEGYQTILNRCTVLDGGGSVLWEQDKFHPFDLDATTGLDLSALPEGKAYEPKTSGHVLWFAKTSLLGTLVTPICLDYLKEDDNPFHQFPGDVYFVPAMSHTLKWFCDRARSLGKKRAAATFVANALRGGRASDRVHAYIAVIRCEPPRQVLDDLYISDILVK